MQRPSSGEIEREAADWAARLDRGLSAEEEGALGVWRDSDPRRLGALLRMRAIALHSERARALGPNFDAAAYVEPQAERRPDLDRGPTRRSFLVWGSAAGAAAAAGLVGAIGLGLFARDRAFETGIGEVRIVTLEDGSVLTLNTASRVSVRYDEGRRSVRLAEGEALFDVARDPARPFVVEAGDAAVRAVGTSFTVRRIADAPVEVLVREGVVELTRAAAPMPVRLGANMRAQARPGAEASPIAVAPAEMARELAWREGRLAFEGETLAGAAAAFARYSETRVVVDPTIAGQEITGLFAANDPVSFARAAAVSLDLEAEVRQGEVRLSAR